MVIILFLLTAGQARPTKTPFRRGPGVWMAQSSVYISYLIGLWVMSTLTAEID